MSHTFTERGVYPYTCMLHAGMTGAVVVGDVAGAAGAATVGDSGSASDALAEPARSSASAADVSRLDPLGLAVGAITLLVGLILGWSAFGLVGRRRSSPLAAQESERAVEA